MVTVNIRRTLGSMLTWKHGNHHKSIQAKLRIPSGLCITQLEYMVASHWVTTQ
jgi:hypothetical protein